MIHTDSFEFDVLYNEIEYLKRRVAELERVNLYKAADGWPKYNENTRWLSRDEVKGD